MCANYLGGIVDSAEEKKFTLPHSGGERLLQEGIWLDAEVNSLVEGAKGLLAARSWLHMKNTWRLFKNTDAYFLTSPVESESLGV